MIRDASDRYLETGYADDEATREQVGRIQDAVNRLPDDHTPDDRQTEALAACVDTAIEDQMWNGGMDVWHTPLTGAQARRLIDWEHIRNDPDMLDNVRSSGWNPDADRYVIMDDENSGVAGARPLTEHEYRRRLWTERGRLTHYALNTDPEQNPELGSDPRAVGKLAEAFDGRR